MRAMRTLLVITMLIGTILLNSGCALLLVPAAAAIGVGVGMEANEIRKAVEKDDETKPPHTDTPAAGKPQSEAVAQ
jgi:hypothetical protein